jgi:hypothetical protein
MKPKKKYNFYTGKETKRIKKIGYQYLGRGKIGKIFTLKVDGKIVYALEGLNGFGKYSPYTKDKSKFKKVEFWEEDFGGRMKKLFENQDAIIKQKPKNKIEIMTKIKKPKRERSFMNNTEIKLTEEDNISFYNLNESVLVRELQLKEGDKLKITIEKK